MKGTQVYSEQSWWRVYRRVFGYVRGYAGYMWVAAILSVFLSVTSGIATYSFLPVFSIVFENRERVAPIGVEISSSSENESGSWLSIGRQIGNKVNELTLEVAGQGSSTSRLWRLVGFITVLTAISSGLTLLVDYIFILIQARGVRRMRQAVFARLCSLPMSYYDKEKTGQIMSRVYNDIGGAISMVAKSLADIMLHTLMGVTFLSLLLLINYQLVLLLFPFLLLVGVFTALIGRWIKRTRKRILELQGDIIAWLQEFLGGMKVVRTFAAERYEQGRWERYIRRACRLEILGAINKALPLRLTELFVVVLSAAVMLAGGWMIGQERLSVAEFLMFFVVLIRFQRPASGLVRVWWNIQNGMAFAVRVFQLLDEPGEIATGKKSVSKIRSGIAFSGVSFWYDANTVLQDISFKLETGKVLALVGPSGAGKSSVVNLLLRFYAPRRGSITLDGIDVQQFSLAEYRSLFGVVTQDTFLFHDTVLHNILYAIEGQVSDEDLQAAVRAAHADEFIKQLPQGFDTVVGDRGVRLSGGQRQRIALARAIIRQPAVLVLDEATSSLDSESESQVQVAIDELVRGRTTLVIAHRLSTVRQADEILVINEGRVVESGQHSELVAKDGLYNHLWQLQTEVALPK